MKDGGIFFVPDVAEKLQELFRHIEAVSRAPIAYHTAGASACIETYVLAMQAAKSTDPAAVRDALSAADYETFYSRIKFTPDGVLVARVASPTKRGPLNEPWGLAMAPANLKLTAQEMVLFQRSLVFLSSRA